MNRQLNGQVEFAFNSNPPRACYFTDGMHGQGPDMDMDVTCPAQVTLSKNWMSVIGKDQYAIRNNVSFCRLQSDNGGFDIFLYIDIGISTRLCCRTTL